MSKLNCLFLGVLCSIFFASCLTAPANNYYREQDIFSNAKYSLVKIETHLAIGTCREKVCETVHTELLSVGSGFFIGEDKSGTLIASAAHVCGDNNLINSAKSFFSIVADQTEIINKAVTVNYKTYNLEIVKKDVKSDLCLGRIRGLYNQPQLEISTRVPHSGEAVYNISAPAGVLHKDAPIMVKGFFSGNDQVFGMAVVSMNVMGGASGSAILDSWGRVIGIVSMKHKDVDYIVYSPNLITILNFY
ncbi:serine protease [Luminiphilus sp.]|nr:serine protease [Luminiphilus sp.]